MESTIKDDHQPDSQSDRWLNRSMLVKLAGLVALLVFALTHHFHFSAVWFFMAAMVSFGAFLLYMLTVVTFTYYQNTEALHEKQQFMRDKKNWGSLLPGLEDGVFLLPLLFIGINPLTVATAALLYGVYHYGYLSNLYCVVRMLAYFIVGLWVLPYGIWPVVLAHAVVDTVVTYNLSNWLNIEDENRNNKLPSL